MSDNDGGAVQAAAGNEAGPSEAARLAERVAEAMYARDHAVKAHGISIEAVGPGYARLAMTVRPDMVNGHDLLHGGMTFTLADSAFAYACNSYDERAVAQMADIRFLAAGHSGDRLTAEAREQHRAGRSGIYDITVSDQNGRVIALFRGQSRTIGGRVTEDPGPGPAAAPNKQGRET
ncbi:hydroxyphenylacetyl-CoA thioesterase PaaI [Oceanibacterium hippocampi]|uniref:Acyl-coenzyme A thioesterase PaaI n=1 Tax=Oceanibacterium hippocampi TaxID=745714 RepID=A0A1Y5U0J9_9PROT|nr:hydroxyphenylacetyl-CoA thioesterase PaaI [Oceanibacterium hippocampi]SLN77418.1 Acyl-coenzyme A thioesterase PaaI [Oceanibacterium hippocampi]